MSRYQVDTKLKIRHHIIILIYTMSQHRLLYIYIFFFKLLMVTYFYSLCMFSSDTQMQF